MKKYLLAALLVLMGGNVCSAQTLATYQYHVEKGDTLTIIAEHYATHPMGEREFLEFREGIKEVNYGAVFKYREEPIEGDILQINVWED